MAEWIQRASELVEGLAFQPVAAISRNLTLDEMAARIGTTREMVCRALYSFSDLDSTIKRNRLIEVTRTEFMLTNRDGLAQLSEHM